MWSKVLYRASRFRHGRSRMLNCTLYRNAFACDSKPLNIFTSVSFRHYTP